MRIRIVEFTPDGSCLVTGGHNKTLNFYRLNDLKLALEVSCLRIKYIDFISDGRLMLTAPEDSGLISVYIVLSNTQHKHDLYQKISNEQLNNRN